MDTAALIADLSRRLESLIRTGTIAEVDHAAVRVKVRTGKLTTTWLPWLEQRAGTTTSWSPPTVGEQIILLCPSGEPAAGLVLRGLHTDGTPPPSNSAVQHVIKFPDGAVIRYNHATSHLDVAGIKTANLIASTKVTIDCPENEITGNVLIGGNLLVKGTATITKLLTYMAGLAGYGTGAGAGTVIRGPITQTEGGFTTDTDVIAAGISLRNHTHVEHGDGGGTTGPAQ